MTTNSLTTTQVRSAVEQSHRTNPGWDAAMHLDYLKRLVNNMPILGAPDKTLLALIGQWI